MVDPLAVAREELLVVIEQLERLTAGLRDEEAGVSIDLTSKLQRLRTQVEGAQSQRKLRVAWKVAEALLMAVAAELVRLLIETLNYLFAANDSRSRLYDSRRMHQIPKNSCWAYAA